MFLLMLNDMLLMVWMVLLLVEYVIVRFVILRRFIVWFEFLG